MSSKPYALVVSALVLAACSSGPPASSSDPGAPRTEASSDAPAAGAASTTSLAPAAEGREEWRRRMSKTSPPKEGCFTVSHPSSTWVEVPCAKPPPLPLLPSKRSSPDTVGAASGDFASQESSGVISWAEGAFPLVTGVTSTSTQFTLQLNSNAYSYDPYCFYSLQDPRPTCQEWEQFVYYEGGIFIQYWLIDVQTACPSGWMSFNNGGEADCFRNSSSQASVPLLALTDLANVTMTASAGSTDTMTLSVGGTLYSISQSSILLLNDWWQAAEFNVFGPGGGSEAFFNAGSTLLVRTQTDTPITASTTSCLPQSFTGETNNLNLAPASSPNACCPLNGGAPGIQFTESNVPGFTPPACPGASCTPTVCSSGRCGVQSDGCGGIISCSGCSTGETCESGLCVRTSCPVEKCPLGMHWVGAPFCGCEGVPHVCECGGVYPRCHLCQ